ncbi:hypothetical protein [Pseudopontixanthobacter vadosimaris]|uniref:hypothetical protein n=1 Tax=Pseudopontixanthobacter vadosimaris TaxID=2726450 RepID=UPI001475412A|nr:hypothetical protein [Pseudopontixanthobacter vadosimaris]
MAREAHDSDRILNAASQSLAVQRAGGRRAGVSKSIGQRSADIKIRHWMAKLKRIVLAIGAIVIAAMVAGLVLDGIGFIGVMVTLLAMIAAVVALATFPRIKAPTRADLQKGLDKGDVRQLVGNTEIWLEHQRPALPPPAVDVVDRIGVQLDALGLQLETVDQTHPAAREVRKLVGQHLPEMVDSYRKVPTHLRGEARGGASPDEQVTQGLEKISLEIDSVTRQLADGALDDLAIKHRYLDYRYGGTEQLAGAGERPAPAKENE